MECPVRLAQSVERCGSQSEGPGFKPRRRRLDSSVGQTANGPCLSRLSCMNEYKVFLRCLPVYGGTTSATIRWCNGASPEVLCKKHLFPKGLFKKIVFDLEQMQLNLSRDKNNPFQVSMSSKTEHAKGNFATDAGIRN